MSHADYHGLLWWLIPEVLAGMPMPYIDPARRLNGGGPLDAYEDELKVLHEAGIRAVVSLLNNPSDAGVYETAGFAFLCLPIRDGCPPTLEQARRFTQFAGEQRAAHRPVAVHCEGGLGRTGTMLAAYLISQGETAESAIKQVRAAEPKAIETAAQIQFLHTFAGLKAA